ncbi:MAG: peptide-methionine (S)-S-oxide reductase MsrA [Ferruginibacter sp.]
MENNNDETATLGNGCFWCTEAVFQRLQGVIKVTSGYSGGDMANPDYNTVCSGVTGHAECLEIVFDKNKTRFEDILEVFWQTHDPTTLNRQGNDVGTQYRSVIFYHSPLQKEIAEKHIERLNNSNIFSNPIVTTLEPFSKFYPAENYHQDYFNLNSTAPYCQFVVKPKLEKFKKAFKDKLKAA